MIEVKEQMRLLKGTRARRKKYETAEQSRMHRNYIYSFCAKHKLLVLSTLGLIIAQGAVETILVVIGRSRLVFGNNGSSSPIFWKVLLATLALFAVNSFFSIKQEKTLIVMFINSLRRRIFKNYLGRAQENMKPERQADIIAKISYHLPPIWPASMSC